MSKLSTTITFLTGAVIGGVTVWYITKEWYAHLAEEEITSVKEAYAQKERKQMDDILKVYREGPEESATRAVTAKVQEKENISEYARRVQNGEPMEYSRTSVVPKPDAQATESTNTVEHPYVIPPEEFGEIEEYSKISLTFFADGVLSDELGAVVDDPEEIVGDALKHFGEYEDDSVFVRNDAKRSDYEILQDERDYEEFRKTLPPNI